jgi:hypothetical protein
MIFVICPCCKGERTLTVHEPVALEPVQIVDCCHCQGKGRISAEVEAPEDQQWLRQ